jgi:hypothetical protein
MAAVSACHQALDIAGEDIYFEVYAAAGPDLRKVRML